MGAADHEYCRESDLVGDLMYSQEGACARDISRNAGICLSSVGRIIHDLFGAIHPEESFKISPVHRPMGDDARG